ncbi:MAG: 30S ribosomal protein S2 [Patescibacteria group bacterium]|jgi:small subunit ribosomal protein S2
MATTLPTLRNLLDAGVHFGHKTSRWHPAMEKYIFTSKSGVHVINLESTAEKMAEAVNFLKELSASGKTVMFVGTKKQAANIIKVAAENCGMPFVNSRWLGGTLTNFDIIRGSVKKFEKNKKMLEGEEANALSKRDRTKLKEETEKAEKVLGGLVKLEKKPDALILIGAHDEKNALREAKNAGIPVIAIVDTNTNPSLIDYPVPANDDATKSIELFANLFSQIIKENKGAVVEKKEETK